MAYTAVQGNTPAGKGMSEPAGTASGLGSPQATPGAGPVPPPTPAQAPAPQPQAAGDDDALSQAQYFSNAVQTLLHRWFAFNERSDHRDLDAMLALMAPDIEMTNLMFPTVRGREGLVKALRMIKSEWKNAHEMSDVRVTMEKDSASVDFDAVWTLVDEHGVQTRHPLVYHMQLARRTNDLPMFKVITITAQEKPTPCTVPFPDQYAHHRACSAFRVWLWLCQTGFADHPVISDLLGQEAFRLQILGETITSLDELQAYIASLRAVGHGVQSLQVKPLEGGGAYLLSAVVDTVSIKPSGELQSMRHHHVWRLQEGSKDAFPAIVNYPAIMDMTVTAV